MKYTKHEYGIESECGQYMLENMEECMEELNELLKQRNEAREMAEWMREMMDTWAECDDTSFPWENKKDSQRLRRCLLRMVRDSMTQRKE